MADERPPSRDPERRDSALGDTDGEEAAQPERAADVSGTPAKKPDLSISSHQDLGVSVSRDLNATGWLARGDRSNMSKLSFSVRAKPRDELDPELAALRDPAAPRERSHDASPADGPSAPAEPAASAAPEPGAPPPEARSDGLLGRLGRLFGGE